jgi:hypothetical protein
MKDNFLEYLSKIGITPSISSRIEQIYKYYEKICPDTITDIFISDYIKKDDNQREYESLCFFSENYCMEAKQFITKDDFDMTSHKKRVTYWRTQSQDYNFSVATEKSRMQLDMILDAQIKGVFKASRENCDYLNQIILKHIIPNMIEKT